MKYKVINQILRFIYHSWNLLDHILREFLFKRIRVSGSVKLQLDDIEFKMYSNCDDGIVDALFFRELKYELNEIKLFKEFSKHSSVIFDIGANTGLYSIVSKLSNPKAKVYSFEPYLINLNRLEKNILLNGLTNQITIIRNAVGESTSEIEFAVPENDQICDVLSADIEFTNRFYKKWITYKNITVNQISIDDFVSNQKIENVNLLKIDVENYELNVFKGALNVLRKSSPIIMVEIFVNPEKIGFYEEALKPLGYYCYVILREGLIRVNSLIENQDCRNFIFSKKKSDSEYVSFAAMLSLVKEIR